jgi:DNA end-binding protein Ku
VVGIARVVLHTKEYLSALIPSEKGLVLHTLRWASDIRETKELSLPTGGRKALKDSDLKMAKQLIGDMTHDWDPEAYEDKFSHAIRALVAKRHKAGTTETVEPMEDAAPSSSNVVDLTALLAQSLKKKPASARSSRSATGTGARRARA